MPLGLLKWLPNIPISFNWYPQLKMDADHYRRRLKGMYTERILASLLSTISSAKRKFRLMSFKPFALYSRKEEIKLDFFPGVPSAYRHRVDKPRQRWWMLSHSSTSRHHWKWSKKRPSHPLDRYEIWGERINELVRLMREIQDDDSRTHSKNNGTSIDRGPIIMVDISVESVGRHQGDPPYHLPPTVFYIALVPMFFILSSVLYKHIGDLRRPTDCMMRQRPCRYPHFSLCVSSLGAFYWSRQQSAASPGFSQRTQKKRGKKKEMEEGW
jgi:hypothetical protein